MHQLLIDLNVLCYKLTTSHANLGSYLLLKNPISAINQVYAGSLIITHMWELFFPSGGTITCHWILLFSGWMV